MSRNTVKCKTQMNFFLLNNSYLGLLVRMLRHILLIWTNTAGVRFESSGLIMISQSSLLLDSMAGGHEEPGVEIIVHLLRRRVESLLEVEPSKILLVIIIVSRISCCRILDQVGVHGVGTGVGRVQQRHADDHESQNYFTQNYFFSSVSRMMRLTQLGGAKTKTRFVTFAKKNFTTGCKRK